MQSEEIKFSEKRIVRIVAISDTHNNYDKLQIEDFPPADIFIHAGDISNSSTPGQYDIFRNFIQALPYKHKIVIGGNHDFGLQSTREKYLMKFNYFQLPEEHKLDNLHELQKMKEYVEVEGVKIFASPYIESSYVQGFNISSAEAEKVWRVMPKNVDILVTHQPPFGVLDTIKHGNYNVGSKNLRQAVKMYQPKIHIFGHVHESHGQAQIGLTKFYNVAVLDHHYIPRHKPTIIELEL